MVIFLLFFSFFWLFLFDSLTAPLIDIHVHFCILNFFLCALHGRLASVNIPITRGNPPKNYKLINEFGLDYAEDVLDSRVSYMYI
jgi:hypothetical protein